MEWTYFIPIVAVIILLIPVGNLMIENYFARKEKFVDHLQNKMKGQVDAKK